MNRHFNEVGAIYLKDTTALSDIDSYGFQVEADAVIASIVYSPGYKGPDGTSEGSNIVGETLTAGRLYLLRFTAITLTSGTILIYRAN